MHNKWMRIGTLLLAALLVMKAHGQELSLPVTVATTNQPIVLSLHDAILLSLRDNPNVREAEIGRVSQKFAVVVAENQFQPQYTLTGSYNWNSNTSETSPVTTLTRSTDLHPQVTLENHYGTQFSADVDNSISNNVYNPVATFSITQPLLQGFGKAVVDAALNNAKDTEITNKLALENTIISTVNTVIQSYLTLLQANQQLAIDQQALANYEQTVQDTQIQITLGKMARTAIVQPQASVAQQKVTIQNDLNIIQQARASLLDAIGLKPDTNIVLPVTIDFNQLAQTIMGGKQLPDLAELQQMVLQNNINYQTQVITLRTLQRAVITAKDQLRWQLNLTAQEQISGDSLNTEETNATSSGTTTNSAENFGSGFASGFHDLTGRHNHSETVGLELTIPIDDVSGQGNVISAVVALNQAQIALEEERRQLINQLMADYASVQSDYNQLQLQNVALQLQKQTVEIAQAEQKAGRVSNFELLTDQSQFITAQQQTISQQTAYINALLALEGNDLSGTLQHWGISIRY